MGPVLIDANELAFPTAATQQLRHYPLSRYWENRFQQLASNLAFGLFCGPPVQLLRAPIPIGDDSIHVAHEYGVMSEIEQISLLPQSFFGLLALGDISYRPYEEYALRIFAACAMRYDSKVFDRTIGHH